MPQREAAFLFAEFWAKDKHLADYTDGNTYSLQMSYFYIVNCWLLVCKSLLFTDNPVIACLELSQTLKNIYQFIKSTWY